MFRCAKVKYSFLRTVPVLNSYSQQFHVSSKTYLRKVSSKDTYNSVKSENLKNDLDPYLVRENASIDFLGIESDEGVITLRSPQYSSLQQPIQRKKIKEKFHSTTFGIVRYDTENKLKFHGQYQSKSDFLFPHSNNEEAEVSKSLQKLPERSVDYSKTFCNNKEFAKNYEHHSHKKKEQNESYIDEYYFSNVSKGDNTNYNNDTIHSSSEELSFVDKNYFGILTTSADSKSSENSTSEKERNKIFDEREQSAKDNAIQSATEELNYFNENYFKNVSVTGSQKSSNMQEFSDDILQSPEATFDWNGKKTSEINSFENFHTNIKPNISDNMKPDSLLNNVTSIVEDNNVTHKCADVPFDIKTEGESFADPYSREINQHEIFNKDCRENLKQALQNNYETSSPFPDRLKANLISKQKRKSLGNDTESDIQVVESNIKENDLKHSSHESEEPDDVSTAHDFVTKLRKEHEIPEDSIKKGKTSKEEIFDSKGFRILKNQVDDLAYFTRDEIFNMLKNNIVYSDADLVVLNKPYGLVIHDSKTTKDHCLSHFLNDLAKEMDQKATDPKLFTVHRLDKETTGCLLLARNETMAQYLKSLFAQRKIIKKYWIITSRVPDHPEGVIDIPISEGTIDNRRRMVLHPKIPKTIDYRNHSSYGKEAITSYKVLSESGNAALVEVFPKTGIKHQIRVHFGFGLSCPILGDHKYSHLDKLAPQKLPSDMLQRLHVRQSKVRHIPMHIHAKSVTIPEYFERRDLLVNIPIPDHMKINLKRLKFRKKDMSR